MYKRQLSDTIASVFREVYTVDVENSSNRELFASNSGKMKESLTTNLTKADDNALKNMMQIVSDNLKEYKSDKKYILTDDKAPVELLGMKVIDEMISDEISYYKKIFKEKGLKGLLESF